MRRPATATRGIALAIIIIAAALMTPALASPAGAAVARHHPHHRLSARQRHEAHAAHLAHLAHLRHLSREHRRAGHRKPVLLSAPGGPQAIAQAIAQAMLPAYGWDTAQMGCLDPLWARESGWNPYAENASSGAYGIPQALPGGKMASAGADWQTSAATQIRWGLQYLRDTYGSPCRGWDHELAYGWY